MLRLREYIAISSALHVVLFGAYSYSLQRTATPVKPPPKSITIRQKPREVKEVVVEPKPVAAAQPKPVTAKPVAKPKPVQKVIPVFKPDAPPAPPAPPVEDVVEEVSDEPVTDDAPVSSAPATSSGGGEAAVDLTREAGLIMSSIEKIEYTKEALRARLTGVFPVDVHLDPDGKVLEVELVQPPGYGMDDRLINALKNAKYNSKRDATGKGLETWATIQFKLEMP